MIYVLAFALVVLVVGLFVARGYYQARQRRIQLELKRRLDNRTVTKVTED